MAKIIVPGDVVKQKMDEYYVSIGKLAGDIDLSQSLVRQIIAGKAKITISAAFKLAKYFNTTPEYWYDLQTQYDFAEFKKNSAKEIQNISKAKKPSAKEIALIEAAQKEKDGRKAARMASAAKKEKTVKQTVKKEGPAKRGRKAAEAKVVKEKPAPKRAVKKAPEPVKAAKEKKENKKTAGPEKPARWINEKYSADAKPRAKRTPKKKALQDAPVSREEEFKPDVILIKNQDIEPRTAPDFQEPSSDPELF